MIAACRTTYATADDEKRADLLTAELARKNVGLELLHSEWHGLEVGVDSVEVRYEMRIQDAISRSGNLRLAKLPWRSNVGERFSMVIASAERKEPLLLYALQLHEDETLRLRLPRGLRMEGLPDTVSLENPYGSFSIQYKNDGTEIVAHRKLRISGSQVPPEEYVEFKGFLERVIREQDAVLVLGS